MYDILLYRLLFHEFIEDPNEYCLSFQVPGCEKESLAVKVNKLHLTVSIKYNPVNLVSPNDINEDYLKKVPDISLLKNNKIDITKNVLLPWNSDINFARAKFSKSDGILTVIVPKLEEIEVLPEISVEIEDEF